jgi:hypothetical protein
MFLQGVGYIVRLLRGQVKLIKSVPAEKRITANFLSQVDVGDPSDTISVRSIEEIKRFCDVLAYSNAASMCRRQHVDFGEPVRPMQLHFDLIYIRELTCYFD